MEPEIKTVTKFFYGWLPIANKNTTIKFDTHTTNNKNSENLANFWAPIAPKWAPKSKFWSNSFLGGGGNVKTM